MTGPGDGRVVVVGGYGQVGRQVAQILAGRYQGRVVVAGRSTAEAAQAAGAIGCGTGALRVDADAPESAALAGASLVVACAGHTSAALARAAVLAGADYVDVTADLAVIEAIGSLDLLARRRGVSVVVSVGLAPGLTNLLARAACEALDRVDRVDLLVQLGLGEAHGLAALSWTLDQIGAAGRKQPAEVGGRRHRFALPLAPRTGAALMPSRRGIVVGRPFPFPEQVTLPRTLDVARVTSWLALQPAPAGAALDWAARLGAGRLLAGRTVRGLVLPALQRTRIGPGSAGAAAVATGVRAGAPAEVTLAITGRSEVELTAQTAALVASQLLDHQIRTGVSHIEEVTNAARMLAQLFGAPRSAKPEAPGPP